jgi:hypothetical protein
MGWRSKGWDPGNENQYGVRHTQFRLVHFSECARFRARRAGAREAIKACPHASKAV